MPGVDRAVGSGYSAGSRHSGHQHGISCSFAMMRPADCDELRKALADAARHALRAVGFRAVTRTVRGAPLRIPLAMGELRSLLFDPAYSPFFNEDDVMDVLVARMRADDVVFDIGAYHGVWAVLLARHAREVVAFEPNPGTSQVLKETIAVNRARNVSASPSRLAASRAPPISGAPAAARAFGPGQHRPSRSRVKVETLDRFVEHGSSCPDVIKIDVEGAEHQVLAGGRRCLAHAGSCASKCISRSCRSSARDYPMLEDADDRRGVR